MVGNKKTLLTLHKKVSYQNLVMVGCNEVPTHPTATLANNSVFIYTFYP